MTELMLRLLKDGKIVGYELIKNGQHLQGDDLTLAGLTIESNICDGEYLDWDSFEMGVKVGDAWIFEGDRLECEVENWKTRTVVVVPEFTGQYFGFWYEKSDGWDSIPIIDEPFAKGKVIGNIHEQSDV